MSHGSEKDPSISSLLSEFKKIDIDKQKQEEMFFGIDLGGTRTRVSIIRPRKHAEGYDVDAIIIADIPSIVSMIEDGKCVVGWAAERRKFGSPLNTFYNMQRLIGRRFDDDEVEETIRGVGYEICRHYIDRAHIKTSYGDRILTPEQIQALILLKIKEFCEIELKTPMKNIVITVPYYFKDPQKQAIENAASIANLNIVAWINVHHAVTGAYYTICNYSKNEKIVLVYDFGGSSFNASVVKVGPQAGENIKVLGTATDLFLGGDNFDEIVFKYLVKKLKRKTGIDVRPYASTVQYIKSTAQNAKMDLSYYTEVDVDFWGLYFNSDTQILEVKRITVKLTRKKFEKLVGGLIKKTFDVCSEALKGAGIVKAQIDEILAIGGTCRIPKVGAAIEEIFNKQPLRITHPGINCANIAAVGAAFAADIVCSERSNDSQPQPAHQELTEILLFLRNQLPVLVQENEAFDLRISDVVDLNPEEIFQNLSNLTKSCYLPIWYTTEYADSLVYRMLQDFPMDSQDLDDESRDCNELRRKLTNEKRKMDCDSTRAFKDRITGIKKKKNELVINELFRMLERYGFQKID